MKLRFSSRFAHGIFLLCWSVFLPPAFSATTDDLPPVQEVLKRVAARAARDREYDRQFDTQYEYQRVKIREVRTTKGKLKQRDVKRRLNQPPGSTPLPAEPNSSPASNDPEAESEPDASPDRIRSRSDYSKRDFPITDEVLSRFDFTLTGREMRSGRPTLILDFQPASRDLPAKTFLDRFINRMAGSLAIDEADSVIVQADLRLVETVTFVAGIAGAVYQLDCAFERARTEDGLWYTPRMNWRADWRELLSRKVVTVAETKDNVRRTTVPSSLNQTAARIELP